MLAIIKGSIQNRRRSGVWTAVDDQRRFTACRLWIKKLTF